MTSVLRKEWKKYFLAFNGVVLGVPLTLGGYFVYNLRNDERFREHFHDKYPDLIDSIHEYIEIHPQTPPRDDIGRQDPNVFRQPVHAKVQLKSGKSILVQVPFDATIQDIHKEALAAHQTDAVVKVEFQDDDVASNTQNVSQVAKTNEPTQKKTFGAETPQSTWPTTYTPRNKRASTTTNQSSALLNELKACREQEAKLEAEKRTGFREIDVIEAEIEAIQAQKLEIKSQLPKKRLFGLF